MVPEIKTVIKKYFVCPNCGQHEFSYGHLKEGQSFGPWCCDHCGHGYNGKVTTDAVEIEPHPQKTVKLMALLKFAPELAEGEEPVHIIVESLGFQNDGVIDLDKSYYFNERTCPWNYLRFNIRHGDDTDPHGIFEFVKAIEAPMGWKDLDAVDQFAMFGV